MKVNDIVTLKHHSNIISYYIVDTIVAKSSTFGEARVFLRDLDKFPKGWYNISEVTKVSEQILRCSLDSLTKDLYNLKSAMKAAGYDTLRGGT
jgi:hypothetical protein